MITRHFLVFGLALTFLLSGPASAQDDSIDALEPETPAASADTAGADEAEALYDKSEEAPQKAAPKEEKRELPQVKSLSDLNTLSEFSDVAVIQKRFLPKTGRFEGTVTGITNLNNPFFTSIGLSAGLCYYIREKYGFEGLFNWTATSARQVTKDLGATPAINTDNLVTSRGFIGGAFKWNPFYGKMTWLNRYIVPFDMNFSAGLGLTRTNEEQNEPTLHLATSQVFALSKSSAVRWDINWNMFNAKTTSSKGQTDQVFQSDVYIGLGMSFYFPEATYR